MLMDPVRPAPLGRYCRKLAGADFSLEANTEAGAVVEPNCFYVLRADRVLLASTDFTEAEAFYKDLCRDHWVAHLDSPDREIGLASAWGLLGLSLTFPGAAKVIEREGTPKELKRLEQMRSRARAAARGGWRKGPRPIAAPASLASLPEQSTAAGDQ